MTGLSIVSPILPIYAKSFGVSYTLAALAISMYAVARLIFDLPVGLLGDRFGRRPMLLLGALIVTISAFLCAYASNFWELLFYRFLQGVGSCMWQTMRTTLLQDILKPEERGRILGYFQAFQLIGSSAGPTIGGVLAEGWGITAPFYGYGLGGLICFVICFFFVSESPLYKKRASQRMGFVSYENVKKLLKNLTYSTACVAAFTMFFLRTGLRSTLLPLFGAVELDLSIAEIGYAISLSTFTNLFATIPFGHAIDKFGRKTVLVPSLILVGITAILFSVARNFLELSLVCVLLGVGTSGAGQAPLALASDATMDMPHGLSMGVYRLFGDVGYLVGPISVGAIADMVGLKPPFYVISVIVFASAIIVQIFAKELIKTFAKK